MEIINWGRLFEDAFEDLSVVEIEQRFDDIMTMGMREKTKKQTEATAKAMGVAMVGVANDMMMEKMAGYSPVVMCYDEMSPVFEIKNIRLTGEGVVHHEKEKKKSGFRGANLSHQNVLDMQRKKKR